MLGTGNTAADAPVAEVEANASNEDKGKQAQTPETSLTKTSKEPSVEGSSGEAAGADTDGAGAGEGASLTAPTSSTSSGNKGGKKKNKKKAASKKMEKKKRKKEEKTKKSTARASRAALSAEVQQEQVNVKTAVPPVGLPGAALWAENLPWYACAHVAVCLFVVCMSASACLSMCVSCVCAHQACERPNPPLPFFWIVSPPPPKKKKKKLTKWLATSYEGGWGSCAQLSCGYADGACPDKLLSFAKPSPIP